MKKIIVILLALCFCSCSKYSKGENYSDLKEILNYSLENKTELEKVLKHYKKPSDSLKLKAAVFLIENMIYKTSYGKDSNEEYQPFFDKIKPIWSNQSLNIISNKKKRFNFIHDSLKVDNITFSLQQDENLKHIKSSYLIENIDLAFKAWRTYPWSANVTFKDFCRSILPYRVFEEPIDSWRKTLMDRYSWVLDSIKDPTSLREATILINNAFNKSMTYSKLMKKFPNSLSFSSLDNIKIGKCSHLVAMNIYSLRAMGIPANADTAPLKGRRSSGHSWCSIVDENGILFAFDALYKPENINDSLYKSGVFDYMPETKFKYSEAPKVFRNTYENHYENLPPDELIKNGVIPLQLTHLSNIDVTSHYSNLSSNVELKLNATIDETVAYLYVYPRDEWEKSSWSIRDTNGVFKFNNMGTNITYLPALVNKTNGNERFLNPFMLNDSGTIKHLNPDTLNLETIRMNRKSFIFHNLEKALKEMVGGVFQGSNFKDFRDAETLFEISSIPEPRTNHFNVLSKNKFRYIRFIHPNKLCRVAEMRFYKKLNNIDSIEQLSGKLISSKSNENDTPEKIIDGDVLTYFVADANKGGWVGLDLGQNNSLAISKIEFYPPNDGNSVEIGNEYELFYWDYEWKSLGIKIAKKEELIYKNCPKNALFLLRNYTKGHKERIFTYENNRQVW